MTFFQTIGMIVIQSYDLNMHILHASRNRTKPKIWGEDIYLNEPISLLLSIKSITCAHC